MHKYTNNLIRETSPYLLQHAHNPVNWYAWNDEALALAKKENKPILLSIGYSACHWCHVMEKESFENEATAQIMNEHFVNIKIDREERPDLDHIYMDAVQAMTGSGGWPLNVFLTPEKKPFFGGTYFPPVRAFNRLSWPEVLQNVSQAFSERRHEIDAQAENLTEHLVKSNSFGIGIHDDDNLFKKENLQEVFQNIMKSADGSWGGFGKAPKFPQSFVIQFLLRYHHVYKENKALDQALLSLNKMIDGGIYDQAGGGFCRYSTDAEWLVPHFEKMLYDNALMLSVLSEAYQLTNIEKYKETIYEIIQFVNRELLNPSGGFYSAIDADSEGEEGKFYVWKLEEVKKILKDDAEIFCSYFNITAKGNWSDGSSDEPRNILWRKQSDEVFCSENNLSIDELKNIIEKGKQKLLQIRESRIRPQLDDKILLSWNCLMNIALSKAFAATGNEGYRQLAIKNMEFIQKEFSKNNQQEFFHSWKNEQAKHPAFLDDYAFLIQALIKLQEITGETKYLTKAKEITEWVIGNFCEKETGFFYFTSENQTDVLIRKKEVYDGAQPSGNAVMAYNLYHLSLFFDLPDWKETAIKNLKSLKQAIIRYPTSFGLWACLVLEISEGTDEIAIVHKQAKSFHSSLLKEFLPHKILMISEKNNNRFPLLSGKKTEDDNGIYLCRNYSCNKPVATVEQLMALIRPK